MDRVLGSECSWPPQQLVKHIRKFKIYFGLFHKFDLKINSNMIRGNLIFYLIIPILDVGLKLTQSSFSASLCFFSLLIPVSRHQTSCCIKLLQSTFLKSCIIQTYMHMYSYHSTCQKSEQDVGALRAPKLLVNRYFLFPKKEDGGADNGGGGLGGGGRQELVRRGGRWGWQEVSWVLLGLIY